MSIVKMKHLRLLGMQGDRDELLRQFQLLGCVEISEVDWQSDPDWNALIPAQTPQTLQRLKTRYDTCVSALAILERYAPVKKSLFARRPEVAVDTLFSDEVLARAEQAAGELTRLESRIRRYTAEEGHLESVIASLEPWTTLDVPLDYTGSVHTAAVFGTLPASLAPEQAASQLEQAVPEAQLLVANQGRELNSVLLICHRDVRAEAMAELRGLGFSAAAFKELHGTASRNAEIFRGDLEAVRAETDRMRLSVADYDPLREDLRLAVDRLAQELARAEQAGKLLNTGTVFALEGWVPVSREQALNDLLGKHTCAWQLDDPSPEEYPDVPVQLKNNKLTKPLNMVTEMYSLPAYDGVDPNPLMAPFFILFYGIMLADMGYGLLMAIAALVVSKKMRPRGGMANFVGLLGLCGISTFVIGALTGSFFGDFIPQLLKIFNPDSTFVWFWPPLFTPLEDTLMILIGSLALGLIQVITGMTVSVVEKCKAGDPLSALFDEIAWWFILAGVVLAVLGIGSVGGVPVVLVIGAVLLIAGQVRTKKGFGIIGGLFGAIYNGVTGIFSDVLSYSRLMALMLAGSIISQVFNTLGGITGNVITFVIISLIGNTLNFALNLLGCYVHDLRLQCLEFFGRFYKDGGKPFQPLAIKTKYVNIIEEEQ